MVVLWMKRADEEGRQAAPLGYLGKKAEPTEGASGTSTDARELDDEFHLIDGATG